MSQTLTSLLAHLVFSTKNRRPIITPEIEPELFAYMGGILKAYESRLLDAGRTSDHVHLLVLAIEEHCLGQVAERTETRQFLMNQVCRQTVPRFSVAGRLRCFLN